ncbi:hypothetical protein H1R20_g10027, partial [Candolleomyces eurysporus]
MPRSDSAFSEKAVTSDFEVLEKDIEQWIKPVDVFESKQLPINLPQQVSRVRAIGFDEAPDLELGDLGAGSPTNLARDALGRAAWASCAVAVRDYDRNIIGHWHQDLDNLLVFSALFCAVITALLVESSGIPNVNDDPSTRLTVINAFWVCSLVLTLNSVMIAILVKQWLAEYTWDVGTSVLSPKQSFALRHLRFELLHKWHVPTIIDYLPLQLVLSVLLFYGGLVTFLTMMHPVVAGLGISLIGVSVVIFALTTLMPSLWPLSPYQSPQAWLSYRFTRAIGSLLAPLSRSRVSGNEKGAKANGWVDHGIQVIQSQSNAGKYETDGLLWVQRSLGVWDPQLIQAAFSCALSLPDPTRVKTLLSLCIKHIPSSVINSDDPEDGLDFSSKFGDTLGRTIYIEVYTAIHEHLSKFLDSEKPLGNSIAEETLQDGVRVLLVLVRHPWTHAASASEKGQLNGWNLLFNLVVSTNFSKIPPVVRVIVTRRVLGTFLDDVLADDERGDALFGKQLSGDYVNDIRLPHLWLVQAFDASGDAEEELLWVLSTSCALFVLINGYTAGNDANGISSCCKNMVQYLETKLKQGGKREGMEKAVRYWTRILSYRESSNANGCVKVLAGRGQISGASHVEIRKLLGGLSMAVTTTPTLGDLKAAIWRLRLLNASDAQEVLAIFTKGNEVAGDYNKESMSLSSRMGGITPEELSLVGDVMMQEFPTSPLDSDRSYSRDYQHALLACLIVHTTADYNLAMDDDSGEMKAQSRHIEAVEKFLRLLVDDEDTISLFDGGQQAALEFLLVAILQQTVRSWMQLSPKPDENFRGLVFDALFKQCSRDQPRVRMVLSLVSLSLHTLEVDGNLTMDPEPTKVLEAITTFFGTRDGFGAKELPQTQTSVHQCVDAVSIFLTFGSAASDPEISESLAKLLQVLRDKCDYASWHHSSKELLTRTLKSLQDQC